MLQLVSGLLKALVFGSDAKDPVPVRTLCLMVMLASIFVVTNVWASETDFVVESWWPLKVTLIPWTKRKFCFSVLHTALRITWIDFAKRWFFHSLLHGDYFHVVGNIFCLSRQGTYLEKRQASLGKHGFLGLMLFLWASVPALKLFIAVVMTLFGMQAQVVQQCSIGFSGILYGMTAVEMYFMKQERAWWLLLWRTLEMLVSFCLEGREGVKISHLGHGAGFIGGLVYLAYMQSCLAEAPLPPPPLELPEPTVPQSHETTRTTHPSHAVGDTSSTNPSSPKLSSGDTSNPNPCSLKPSIGAQHGDD